VIFDGFMMMEVNLSVQIWFANRDGSKNRGLRERKTEKNRVKSKVHLQIDITKGKV
jgi:hypothetical protein